MDPQRFDRFAKAIAGRLSRRTALATGRGVTALPGGARAAGTAQEATPVASPGADIAPRLEFLFVQTFARGTWAPKPGEDGFSLLTLTGHVAQTVYFVDRPERLVGAVPTDRFLTGLGFTSEDPPNAAVVVHAEDGGEEEPNRQHLTNECNRRFPKCAGKCRAQDEGWLLPCYVACAGCPDWAIC